MITITVSDNTPLTKISTNGFGELIETPYSVGDKITIYLNSPGDIGKSVNLQWNLPLFIFEGLYTEKETSPKVRLKQVKERVLFSLFNEDGTNKYPFTISTKEYIFGMVENNNRIFVEYLVNEGIADRNDLEIVGI
jgi:hypothetical protein